MIGFRAEAKGGRFVPPAVVKTAIRQRQKHRSMAA